MCWQVATALETSDWLWTIHSGTFDPNLFHILKSYAEYLLSYEDTHMYEFDGEMKQNNLGPKKD